ncbi:glycerol kinase-like protein, partial [Leptotrombidium deliense]
LVCQILADINGIPVIRPQMIETTALGAAMVAGNTLGLWNIEAKIDCDLEDEFEKPKRRQSFLQKIARSLSVSAEHPTKGADVFRSSIVDEKREEMINAWKLAVERSMRWTKIKKQEQQRREYRIRSTLPIGLFMLSSFAILILSTSSKL